MICAPAASPSPIQDCERPEKALASPAKQEQAMITEENFLDCQCPHCGETNSFPQACAGRLQACVNCLNSLIVPDDGSAAGRKIPLPIATPRLVLRRLEPDDWKDLVDLWFDDDDQAVQWLKREVAQKLTAAGEPRS